MRHRNRGPGPKKKGDRSRARRIRQGALRAGKLNFCVCDYHLRDIITSVSQISYRIRTGRAASRAVRDRRVLVRCLNDLRADRLDVLKQTPEQHDCSPRKPMKRKPRRVPPRAGVGFPGRRIDFVPAVATDEEMMSTAPVRLPHRPPDITWDTYDARDRKYIGTMFEPTRLREDREYRGIQAPPTRATSEAHVLDKRWRAAGKTWEPFVEYGKTLFDDEHRALPIRGVDDRVVQAMRTAAPEGASVPEKPEDVDLLSLALFKLDQQNDYREDDKSGASHVVRPGFVETVKTTPFEPGFRFWAYDSQEALGSIKKRSPH